MSSLFGIAAGGSQDFYDFKISNSLRFDEGSSGNLERTPSSEGTRTKFTLSMWVKRSIIETSTRLFMATNNSSNATYQIIGFTSNDQLSVLAATEGQTGLVSIKSTAKFRDVSAWYNIVVAQDTTQSTSSNRFKLYVNGTEIESFASSTYGSQNAEYKINDDHVHYINKDGSSLGNNYSSYYIAEVNFIDGQALEPTSFGRTKSGVWIPKDTGGLTFGTNGFRLQFKQTGTGTASSTTIGADTSGQTNHFTSANLISEDVVVDSPTLNYATMNSLDGPTFSTAFGNLRVNGSTSTAGSIGSTIHRTSGKWYVEMVAEDMGNGMSVGIKSDSEGTLWKPTKGESVIYQSDGNKIIDGGSASSYGATYTVGDIIGLKINLDDGEIEFLKNNSSQGNASTSLTSNLAFGVFFLDTSSANNAKSQFNFGQDSSFHNTITSGSANASDENGHGDFYYSVPSGYLALNTDNLPDPAISPSNDELPEDYFEANLWTGNGSSQSISSYEFSPDWVWIKERSSTSSHMVYDTIRGTDVFIQTNSTVANTSSTVNLTSFDSNGFSLGSGGATNQSSQTNVGWAWLAGGTPTATNSAGAGNAPTSGSVMINGVASTASLAGTNPALKISANTKAGFSIIKYSGTSSSMTFAHGLGATPDFLIIKRITASDDWIIYPLKGSGNLTGFLEFDSTTGGSDSVLESVTSTVIGLASSGARNNSGDEYICYAFTEIEGYSKFGKYQGNSSADGAYVHTGFKPAYLLNKISGGGTGHWHIYDNMRGSEDEADANVRNRNELTKHLYASVANAEGATTDADLDFLSNGFKWRGASSGTTHQHNVSNDTYMYMAFAEMPFKYANAR